MSRCATAIIDPMDFVRTFSELRWNPVGSDRCFLCARRLAGGNRTNEHVVPRWIQRFSELRDQWLVLRNGTRIQYRAITVPCCAICNSEALNSLERKVRAAIVQDQTSPQSVSDLEWYLWVGKIRLALAYKDCLLMADVANRGAGPLGQGAELDHVSVVRHLLQIVRYSAAQDMPDGPPPDSVFLFRCQVPDEQKLKWDMVNLLKPMVTAIRCGQVGVVVVFRDEGAIRDVWSHKFLPYRFMELHPIQFIEIAARVAWLATHQFKRSCYSTVATDAGFQLTTAKCWSRHPIEMFEDEVDHTRWPDIFYRFHEVAKEYRRPVPESVSFMHGPEWRDISQFNWDQVKATRGGQLASGVGWVSPDDPPDVAWIESG